MNWLTAWNPVRDELAERRKLAEDDLREQIDAELEREHRFTPVITHPALRNAGLPDLPPAA